MKRNIRIRIITIAFLNLAFLFSCGSALADRNDEDTLIAERTRPNEQDLAEMIEYLEQCNLDLSEFILSIPTAPG